MTQSITMGKRAGKPWEPETAKCYAISSLNAFNMWHTRTGIHTVSVRVIRERDYQKLLRLASKNRGNGK